VQETHAAVGQGGGQGAGLRGHIRHLRGRRQRQAILPGDGGRVDLAAGEGFGVHVVALDGKGRGMGDELAGPEGRLQVRPAFGRLAGPVCEHLGHHPARGGPGKLLFGRQVFGLIHNAQGMVDHAGAVVLHNVFDAVGKADVEMGFAHDDDLFDRRGGRWLLRRGRIRRAGQRCRQAQGQQRSHDAPPRAIRK